MKYSLSFIHHSEGSVNVDVISLYRSGSNSNDGPLLCHLKRLTNKENICIISGDFNINYKTSETHPVISELLSLGFQQLIDTPTHGEGGVIDHLYIYQPPKLTDVLINYSLFTPLYSDHAGISVVINKESHEFIQFANTVSDDAANVANERRTEKQGTGQSGRPKRKSSTK